MIAFLMSLAACASLQSAADTTTFDVMTFNVRYDNPLDGDHAWDHRKERVAAIMLRADIIGVQEALFGQVNDLQSMLPGYAWFGAGRDDGMEAGEYSPVFYRQGKFQLIDRGTFWLSEQPELPGSVGWDAAITRIVTWGRLRHTATGETFWMFNTHFDHRGREARRQSASLLIQRLGEMAYTEPVIVTGDFNASHSSAVYRTMTAGRLEDARHGARTEPRGPQGTFSGFEGGVGLSEERIDYIFADDWIPVHAFEVIDEVEDGHYPSDHRPVLATLALQ